MRSGRREGERDRCRDEDRDRDRNRIDSCRCDGDMNRMWMGNGEGVK